MSPATLTLMAAAIMHREGYFDGPGKRPRRNRNPLDLRGWPLEPTDADGFSRFASPVVGCQKGLLDLTNHAERYPQQTLRAFIAGDAAVGWPGYAPASDSNDAAGYALFLANCLGVTPDTTFAQLP